MAVSNPNYRIAIVPSNNRAYIPYLPSHKDLGIEGPYFIYVYVSTKITSPIIGNRIFLKEDNTLFLFYNDAFHKVERIEHIPNVEDNYIKIVSNGYE